MDNQLKNEATATAVARADQDEAQKNVCDVQVTYGGRTMPIKANLHEVTQALLQESLKQFEVTQAPHTLSLWTEAGQELQDQQSLGSQGVVCGQLLLLRPGAVKGGRR